MPLSVCVAADVLGRKRNLEFFFDVPPTLMELRSSIERSFNTVLAAEGVPRNFIAANLRLYDERISRWVELEVSSQLFPSCQVYVFQPGVAEIPGEIPPAVRATEITYVSPNRSRSSDYYGGSTVPLQPVPQTYSHLSSSYSVPPPHNTSSTIVYRAEPAPDIPGESILRQERDNEERKMGLDLDTHREMVRRETQDFISQSPSRSASARGSTSPL
eukprot:PhF_6_TR11337/c0_g1_i1/m.18314